jgi:F0F1-type ATP synthase delta subunit
MTLLEKEINKLEPATALAEIGKVLGELLSHQDEEERAEFFKKILGSAGESKVGSMVNL